MQVIKRDQPTEPGWYYARNSIAREGSNPKIIPTRIQSVEGKLFVMGFNSPAPLDWFYWYGPVPEAELVSEDLARRGWTDEFIDRLVLKGDAETLGEAVKMFRDWWQGALKLNERATR